MVRHLSLGAVLPLLVLSTNAAPADVPSVLIQCGIEGGPSYDWHPEGSENGDGTYTYGGTWNDPGGQWALSLQTMTVKPDPFISVAFGVINNTNATQPFAISVTLPVFPTIPGASLFGGSLGGSVTDADFSGSALLETDSPAPLYLGMIDGTGVLPLHADPFSVSVEVAGGTTNIPSVSAGLPGPTLPGPAVLTDIRLDHRFLLSSHDSAAMTSFFIVVPEPAAVLLLGFAGTLLRRR